MAQDIIPDSHSNRLDFFKNLKKEIAANAAALALDAAAVTAANGSLDPLIAAYQTLVDAETAEAAASATADQVFNGKNESLRALFNQLKSNPKFVDGMGEAMRIFSQTTQRNPADTTPRIKATAEPGHIRITGSKDYAELINIYMRLAGTPAWTLIGIRRKKLPFDDQTPLKTPGTPEMREYMARGVIGDEEVGQQSGIVTAVFGE